MKRRFGFLGMTLLLTLLAPISAFALRSPGTGGDQGCQTCATKVSNGEVRIACVSPGDMGNGYDKCQVKCYGFVGGGGSVQCDCWYNGHWCMAIMVVE